jgi:hypothetical protein
MRTMTAYFVGAGTVVAAITAGLGGGLLIANVVSPSSPKHGTEMTKLEQRMPAKPIAVMASPSVPVPYLDPAATTAAATSPAVVAPAPRVQAEPAQQAEAASAKPPAEQPAQAIAARGAASSAQPVTHSPPAALAAREQATSSEDALAKTRDLDVKRATPDRRRAERRQQSAERRRLRPTSQDDVLRDVEQKVREDTEPTRAVAAEPVRLETPRIRLFDPE